MKPKLDKGGIYSAVDLKDIAPSERAAATQNEKAVALVDEAKDEARRAGGGDFFQAFDKSEGEALQNAAIVSTDFAKKTGRDLNDDTIRPLRMIANDRSSPFGFTWVLMDRDAQSVNEGRHCPHCLAPQADILSSQCDWRYKNAGVTGCGYNRIAERFFDEHGASAS